ncbi:MAG: hypothetical protein FJX77_16605 [Armatimonadetes bacterium]|nr:hypothetical protein [Armatimonadota bacterium]
MVRLATQLARYERPPGFLENLERGLLRFCDPVLRLVGLAPGGFSLNALDFARRTAAATALRDLAKYLEAVGDDVPDTLNLTGLEELQVAPQIRERILGQFAGRMLESYRKTGRNRYLVRARARDAAQTLFELTPQGVREIPE